MPQQTTDNRALFHTTWGSERRDDEEGKGDIAFSKRSLVG